MLFLGSLDWRPNLDAVRLLLDDILPRVQAAEPRATLAIVGRKPPDSLRTEAANRPGVELHADVPDVRPFLRSAGMLVVPLRIGGGSRLKILEALATGTPVIDDDNRRRGFAFVESRALHRGRRRRGVRVGDS